MTERQESVVLHNQCPRWASVEAVVCLGKPCVAVVAGNGLWVCVCVKREAFVVAS
jgi:hypothetical protein